MADLEVFESKKDHKFYWHLKDDNGEVIAQGEGYETRASVIEGVANVAAEFAKILGESVHRGFAATLKT